MKESADNKTQSPSPYFSTDHLKEDLKKHAIRGGGISIFSRTASYAIQLGGTIVLARLLTPGDFGLVAMVTAITGFFLIFKDLGLTDATIQKTEINHKQISTLFWINFASSIAITLIIIAVSPLIAWFFGEPKVEQIAIVSSISFVFAGLSTQHIALLKRGMLFVQITYIEILATLGSAVTGIFLAWYGWGYWALVARPIALGLLLAIGAWIVCGWRPGLPAIRSGVRSLLTFGANTTGFYFVNYFAKSLDRTLIGWRFGAKQLGFYHNAIHLSILPVEQLTMPLYGVAVSTLSKLRGEHEKYRHYFINAMSVISFAGFPICGYLVAMSDDLIFFLLGPQWGKTAKLFSILGVGGGIQIILATQGWLHASLGRADRWLRWGIFQSFATVLAFFLGLPFGTIGVATAYTVSRYLLVGPALSYAGAPINLKFTEIFSGIWRYFLSAVGAGLFCWYLFHSLDAVSIIILKLLLSFLFFVCAYFVFIVVLFQSMHPIKQFISLMGEMTPNVFIKTSR